MKGDSISTFNGPFVRNGSIYDDWKVNRDKRDEFSGGADGVKNKGIFAGLRHELRKIM